VAHTLSQSLTGLWKFVLHLKKIRHQRPFCRSKTTNWLLLQGLVLSMLFLFAIPYIAIFTRFSELSSALFTGFLTLELTFTFHLMKNYSLWMGYFTAHVHTLLFSLAHIEIEDTI
jgi:hypothetical protein